MLSARYYIFLAIILLAVSFSFIKQEVSTSENIIQSPQDDRQYQYYRLNNGLKVLLVSTPDSKQASAAVSVDVGSGDDPKAREGIAHFLEHMLFLGTKQYPEAGEYQSYISQHGGFNNAFTAYRQTTYYFEINNQALEGALDRFAPFFISPMFSEKYVNRERKAVHAEYRAKFRDDYRRIYAATKQAFNPKHPYSQFAVGSLDTLSNNDKSLIRDDVMAFYKTHYSADKMSLVVAGNYPLSQLKQWVDERFKEVPKRKLEPRVKPAPLFDFKQTQMLMKIKPIKNLRRLNLIFAMPETDSLYAYKPISFISNLIGHEGEGSLLALFKEKGWAEGLGAGSGFNSEFASTLSVNISLTEAGINHIDEMTQALFHYIKFLYHTPAYLLKEQQNLNKLAFEFHEKHSISQTLIQLSSHLLRYPAKDVLYANYRQEAIDQKTLKLFLDKINPSNMLRVLIAPEVETTQTEKWYQTPYSLTNESIKQGSLNKKELSKLQLPKPNPFVPESLELEPNTEQTYPEILQQSDYLSAWYYPEHEFKTPKTRLFVLFKKQSLQKNLKKRILLSLFVRTLNETLTPYSYPAALAGLSYQLDTTESGMQLTLSGYQEKLPVLLEEILKSIQNIKLSDEEFVRYKKSLIRQLTNMRELSPYKKAIDEVKRATIWPDFSEQDWLKELKNITKQELLNFAHNFKQNIHTQIFVHASDSKAKAKKLVDMVEEYVPASAPKINNMTALNLPNKTYQKDLNLPHSDKLYALYIQADDTNNQLRATYALLGSIIATPYYQNLRTEQQLGYIVFATQYPQRNVPGLLFLVQSPKYSPTQIQKASSVFFNNFTDTLKNLSQEEFNNHKQGLINRLLEPTKNMAQKADRFWQALNQDTIIFDKRAALAQAVKNTSLQQVQALYEKIILNKSASWIVFTQGGMLKDISNLKDLNKKSLPSIK